MSGPATAFWLSSAIGVALMKETFPPETFAMIKSSYFFSSRALSSDCCDGAISSFPETIFAIFPIPPSIPPVDLAAACSSSSILDGDTVAPKISSAYFPSFLIPKPYKITSFPLL